MECLPFFGPDLTVQAVWWEKSRDDGHRFSEGADANNPIDDLTKEEKYNGQGCGETNNIECDCLCHFVGRVTVNVWKGCREVTDLSDIWYVDISGSLNTW